MKIDTTISCFFIVRRSILFTRLNISVIDKSVRKTAIEMDLKRHVFLAAPIAPTTTILMDSETGVADDT